MMGHFKRLKTSWSVSLEAYKMYYVMYASTSSLHSLLTVILLFVTCVCVCALLYYYFYNTPDHAVMYYRIASLHD